MKKLTRIITVIIVLVLIVLAGVTAIKFWPKSNKPNTVKIINKIDDYDYTLSNNETSLHKKYFNQLVSTLKNSDVNEEDYAKLVVQLFVSDFYNLDNKTNKNDVGGTQYIYSGVKDDMILKAKDTIYKYVESNLNDKRDQKLPVVTDVKIDSIKQKAFKYGKQTDNKAYEVDANWTYKEDLGYQDSATLVLIHENKKLSIAELK